MRRLLTLVAAGAAIALPLATPAAAATPAAGAATSAATLVSVIAAGHTLDLGTLSAVADGVTDATPGVSFTPITLDDVATGTVSVDPSNSPRTVGSVAASGVPAGILSATSPGATLHAQQSATDRSSGVNADFGTVTVLGMPLKTYGSLQVASVAGATKGSASKTLRIDDISLPTVADLLAAAGIDLSKLPVPALKGLFDAVSVTAAMQTAFDAARGAADAAQATVTTRDAARDAAEAQVTAAQAAVPPAAAGYTAALAAAGLTQAMWDALTPAGQALFPAVQSAETAFDAANAAVSAAQAAATTATAALDAALATLAAAVASIAGIVDGALNTPLVSIDSAEVSTRAIAGAGEAATVTGTMSGLKVLGTDLLFTTLGNSTLDLGQYASTISNTVNGAISTAVGTLTSAVSSATGLVIPVPQVGFLVKQTSLGTDGGFRTATTTVDTLSISLAEITVPSAFALPGIGTLPGISSITGGYRTAPLSIAVGRLSDAARFRPASSSPATTVPGGAPSLPNTGLSPVWALLAGGLLAISLGTRRLVRARA